MRALPLRLIAGVLAWALAAPAWAAGFNPDSDCANLTQKLTAGWALEEASGERADVLGSETLTDNNTVTQVAGKVSQAAQFTSANSEFLSRADDATMSLSTNTNWTITAWVYLDTKPGAATFAAKYNSDSGVLEYLLRYDGGGTDRFTCFIDDGGGITQATANTFGSPSTATWYFLMCQFDTTANTIGISVNNGTIDTTAYTRGTQDSAVPFTLGANSNNAATGANFHNGRIDEAYFFKGTVLGATQISELYNSGNGNTYGSGSPCDARDYILID